MNRFRKPSLPIPTIAVTFIAMLMTVVSAISQQPLPASGEAGIQGTVRTSDGKNVSNAEVRLERKNAPATAAITVKTDSAGAFALTALKFGTYQISAQKSGLRTPSPITIEVPQKDHNKIDLVLEAASASLPSASDAMEFADKPDFTVAGVTDWTAAGGHGSDSSLRTTEDLTRQTLTLKSTDASLVAGDDNAANHQNADAHRLSAELAEKRGDPLAAVNEYEQAARLDPSEQNYFAWGSELLLHRAVWQAQEVFQKGANTYPKSARLLTGLATALFAGARYDDAALRLCEASNLNPTDPEPYIFMGKIQLEAPNQLPCVEQKLAQFVQQQPDNSLAIYLYAMAILKRQQQGPDMHSTQEAETLLTKAVTIDPKCADAYLQLGILSYAKRDFQTAISLYSKAIEAAPQLGDAHYRLGVAYDRVGETAKAKEEFKLHDEIKKKQADAVENERREIKQFRVVLPEQTTNPDAH